MNEPWRSRVIDYLIRWGDYMTAQRRLDERHPFARFFSYFAAIFTWYSFFGCLWDIHPEKSFRAHVADNAASAIIVTSILIISAWRAAKKTRFATVNKLGV